MKSLFKIISVCLITAIVFSLTGCGGGNRDAIVYFELSQQPLTVDAQLASSDSELLIVRNIYEGLLRKDADGKIVCGACSDCSKSGLTYTFNIREDATWSDGTALTADDFVFGLRRAVDKKTAAPFASRLFAIENAEQINSGSADTTSLGVVAQDEHTLSITLSYEDENFLDTLTTSIAMPCNENFFDECIGKYGLGSQYVISNGSYSLTKWNKEDFGIRIYRNDEYNGFAKSLNKAVFFSCRDDKTPIERLNDNSTDMTFLPNCYIAQAKEDGMNIKSYQNICWVMTLGKEYSKGMRSAFAKLVSGAVYGDSLPDGFTVADSLFPSVFDEELSSGAGVTPYDKDGAWQIFSKELLSTEDKVFPTATLCYLENDEIKPAITAQIGHWQQNLSAFINSKPCKAEEFNGVLTGENDIPFSVFPITAKSSLLWEYLANFGVKYSGQPLSDIQTEILKDNTVIPFAFENTNIVYTNSIKNVYTEAQNGYIDFSFTVKEE